MSGTWHLSTSSSWGSTSVTSSGTSWSWTPYRVPKPKQSQRTTIHCGFCGTEWDRYTRAGARRSADRHGRRHRLLLARAMDNLRLMRQIEALPPEERGRVIVEGYGLFEEYAELSYIDPSASDDSGTA